MAKISKALKKRGPAKGTPRKRFLRDNEALVFEMHCDHVCGMNLRALQKKYGYMDGNIKKAFVHFGLKVKVDVKSGQFKRTMRRFRRDELVAMALAQKRICKPKVLRQEWREWPMKKRAWFIGLMRKNLPHLSYPQRPFSANVEPFDYASPSARELLRRMNDGRHIPGNKLKIESQGVIWQGQLWFWTPRTGYQEGVKWTPTQPRRLLHRAIWESVNGPLPEDGVVRHADGNPNNFDPDNLVLATKNDVARENQAAHMIRKSREKTRALLNFQQSTEKGTNDDLTERIFKPGVRGSGGRGGISAAA
ncbi:HNH endonuclease [Prosthecobacter sp.]|uniref:HNH endonuclease signature motif containing protein n=1 Tax=Prosthecobacter sp. TaxID=1965333 RepID=UPI0037835091